MSTMSDSVFDFFHWLSDTDYLIVISVEDESWSEQTETQ